MPDNGAYDAYYYAHCCGRPYERNDVWLAFFGGIADRIAKDVAPRRVLDAGCAMGFLVETLRARGVEAWGIDLSAYAIERVHGSVRDYCRVASVTEPLSERYDLIVCIEVLEHLPPREAEAAIQNLCAHTDEVLFSSTPQDHREPTHINVQPVEGWAETFARHGFIRDVEYDASYITPWAVRFRRSQEPLHRVVRGYEREFVRLGAARHESRQYAEDLQRTLSEYERELADTRQRIRGIEDSLVWRATHPIAALRSLRRRRREKGE